MGGTTKRCGYASLSLAGERLAGHSLTCRAAELDMLPPIVHSKISAALHGTHQLVC